MSLPSELQELQSRLLPLTETRESQGDALRQAAVLVLLYPSSDGVYFLLTERPASLSSHAGQMSLPGGAAEPEDETLCHTALRETREELGIDTDDVFVLGKLETVDVRVSRYSITPFVAWSDRPPRVRAHPGEVASVLPVTLSALVAPDSVHRELWDMHGSVWCVCLYRFSGFAVWGATARVLADLASRFAPQAPMRDPLPGSVLAVRRE